MIGFYWVLHTIWLAIITFTSFTWYDWLLFTLHTIWLAIAHFGNGYVGYNAINSISHLMSASSEEYGTRDQHGWWWSWSSQLEQQVILQKKSMIEDQNTKIPKFRLTKTSIAALKTRMRMHSEMEKDQPSLLKKPVDFQHKIKISWLPKFNAATTRQFQEFQDQWASIPADWSSQKKSSFQENALKLDQARKRSAMLEPVLWTIPGKWKHWQKPKQPCQDNSRLKPQQHLK